MDEQEVELIKKMGRSCGEPKQLFLLIDKQIMRDINRSISVFCMFTCICGVAAAQERPNLRLEIPSKLSGLNFGDPIYVPITISNHSDAGLSAPSLARHDPPLAYEVICGELRVPSSGYGMGVGGGETRMLAAKSKEHTVMLFNIWTPAIGLAISRTNSAVIRLRLFPNNYTNADDVLEGEVELQFMGTAFEQHDEVLELGRRIASGTDYDELVHSGLTAGRPGTFVFSRGQSPLAWLDSENEEFHDWVDPNSTLWQRAQSVTKRDSMLFRMMRFRTIIDSLRGIDKVSVRPAHRLVEDYLELLDKCSLDERFYQVIALSALDSSGFPTPRRIPELSKSEIIEKVSERYPELKKVLESNIYSVTTIMDDE